VIAVIAGYANSLDGVLLFDDLPTLLPRERIDHLWPPWNWLATERPTVFLTLAVNYALGGLEVRGYHILNMGIHLLASLTLYGVVRRTLETESFRTTVGSVSSVVALWTALLWAVHPLQTESVTYLIQRGESLMGLFYLLTLYGTARGAPSRRRWAWHAISIGACALGMGAKAVMVTAPVAALLYDRWFLAKSFGRALRDRWPLYVGLASTWGVLLACGVFRTVFTAGSEYETVGYGLRGVTAIEYARTQAGVILHYLWLCFYPIPLCLDYAWPIADWKASIPSLAAITAALAVAIFLSARRHWVGFASALFFLVLAPTSSIIPIRDAAFEHRMYLPLAAVIVAVVGGVYLLAKKFGESPRLGQGSTLAVVQVLGLVITLLLGGLTVRRNRDYTDELRMWSDVVAKRPGNPRGHMNLGVYRQRRGLLDEAVASYGEAVALDPDYGEAYYNLGTALVAQRRLDDAAAAYHDAVRCEPGNFLAWTNLGDLLKSQRHPDEAEQAYRQALAIKPGINAARLQLASLLVENGRKTEAATEYRRLLETDPQSAEGHYGLANVLLSLGSVELAGAEYRRALELQPAHADAANGLGNLFFEQQRADDAIAMYRRAVDLNPANGSFHRNLGSALAVGGRLEEAAAEFTEAIRIDPDSAGARFNLGNALARLGRVPMALEEFRIAARLDPTDVPSRINLGNACFMLGRLEEAIEAYQSAITVDPSRVVARQRLAQTLAKVGRAAEAIEQYRAILQLDPTNTEAQAALTDVESGRR